MEIRLLFANFSQIFPFLFSYNLWRFYEVSLDSVDYLCFCHYNKKDIKAGIFLDRYSCVKDKLHVQGENT